MQVPESALIDEDTPPLEVRPVGLTPDLFAHLIKIREDARFPQLELPVIQMRREPTVEQP